MTTAPLLDELPLGQNLPSLPVVALEVLRVSQDDDATVEDLTQVLAQDPALSAKVLQMANSPLFSRGGGSITSLQRASSLLGFRAVKVIALGFSLASELPMRGEEAGFDLTRYWHRSLVNAVVARSLAQASGSKQAEEAFLVGLLADIGKLVLAQAAPDAYGRVVAAQGGWPDTDSERAELGYDSIDVACALLHQWGVPSVFAVAILHGARAGSVPAELSQEAAELARVLGLSLQAAAVVFDEDKSAAIASFTDAAASVFGFGDDDVRSLMEKVDVGVKETAAIFDVQLPPGVSYQSIVDAARIQMVSVGLGAAADLREEQARTEELETRVCTDGL
ncbi:MAG: HDOD domain-containing protein, partial [Acidimicrobiales bacterium]|nr:HDOD domain-containing protein [Acidimicrobiales bacterium]